MPRCRPVNGRKMSWETREKKRSIATITRLSKDQACNHGMFRTFQEQQNSTPFGQLLISQLGAFGKRPNPVWQARGGLASFARSNGPSSGPLWTLSVTAEPRD